MVEPGRRWEAAPRSAGNVHISGGTGIGGVLEPLQRARHHRGRLLHRRTVGVAEGVIVERAPSLSMGVLHRRLDQIVDRDSGEIFMGRVPAYSVVVPGTLPGRDGGPGLACAVIVKRVDARTRSKTSINELLRD